MQVDEDLQGAFYEMEDLWERKLWFQLTETVIALFKDERSKPVRFQLFQNFVSVFESNINQLAFVSLAISASDACESVDDSLQLMVAIAADVDKPETLDVWVYAQLHIASLYLKKDELMKAKKIIDQATKLLDELHISNQVITAAYYGVCCEYYKAKADYSSYYRNALLYLACIDSSDLNPTQKQARAYDLAISALLGDKIYNFGELVMHPILNSLDGEYKWLRDLVQAVNAGNIRDFQAQRGNLAKAPVLESKAAFLDQKICLMALCECVFRRPATDRVLSFDTIARETHLHAESKVEVLVLKAFSMDLLRGSIDQIDRTVTISWLQPRILDHDQVASMSEKLRNWDSQVQNLGLWMHKEGETIWVK